MKSNTNGNGGNNNGNLSGVQIALMVAGTILGLLIFSEIATDWAAFKAKAQVVIGIGIFGALGLYAYVTLGSSEKSDKDKAVEGLLVLGVVLFIAVALGSFAKKGVDAGSERFMKEMNGGSQKKQSDSGW